MKLTRGIALAALTLAIALAIGAISPLEPFARAMPEPIIIIATPALAVPLATPALAAAPVEQLAAAPVEQLPQASVEQLPQASVEQLPQASVEQLPQASVEQPVTYTYQSEQLHDLSLDASAAPACDPGIESAYCTLPIQQAAPAPAGEYEPMTARQQEQSRQRTR